MIYYDEIADLSEEEFWRIVSLIRGWRNRGERDEDEDEEEEKERITIIDGMGSPG